MKASLYVAGLVAVFVQRDAKRYVVVDFPQTNSLYEGSDVKVLGVAVGTVEKLTPRGESVRAKISYAGDVRLPSDVKAVVVSPSIVGDRFVQLAPAYGGGQALPDNARLGIDRTAVPVELDEVYSSLSDLTKALGPEGANKDGALSRLVKDSATQLEGQGAQLNETLRNFGKLSSTLSDNKDELFGSVREVDQFVDLLARNDTAVRAFFDSTAEVSTVLEGERDDLQATLEALSKALIEVRRLVRDNRDELRGNVKNLQTITEVLGRHRKDIEEITVNAPTALSNVAVTYNAESGTLDTRSDILELLTGALPDVGSILCNAAPSLPLGDVDLGEHCEILGGILGQILNPLAAATSQVPSPDDPSLPALPEGAPELPLDLPRTAAPSQGSPDPTMASLTDMLAVDR